MATMIPPFVAQETRSHGEREVFRRLRDDPGTQDWIVLHSLGLAEHQERIAGEVDFVVIIPLLGVLCLEVKGSSAANLRRDERGFWYYGPQDKGESRSPFRQASEGMHALRRWIQERQTGFDGVQFSSGVIFPFAPFRPRSIEWGDWEVIDSRRFLSAPISRLLREMMLAWRTHLLAAPHAPHLAETAPTASQCESLQNLLRGSFELPVDPRRRSERLREELIRYTAEQFSALDAMAGNRRVIFTGPAGVGKTFLALEAARRASVQGDRVLLVCYNTLLGSWLEEQTAPLGEKVTAGTLHRQMLRVSGRRQAPEGASDNFWRTELPEEACDRLLEQKSGTEQEFSFDLLVIDEAQDLLRGPYLDFLDLSVRGGLGSGRWDMFGDFERQAIYDADGMSVEDFQHERAGQAPVYSLRINCRNTPLIVEWIYLLAGLEPKYQRVLRPDDGVSPNLLFYETHEEQNKCLITALAGLERAGFQGRDIVVLSTRSDTGCAASTVRATPYRDRLRPISRGRDGHVGYSSIHAFKGLEAPAIVVTDVETIGTPQARALLYVAITRPLQRLIIIAHSRVRVEAEGIVLGGT